MNQKKLATKNTKIPSESLENWTTSEAGIFNLHFSLLFFFNEKIKKTRKRKRKNLKHPTTRKAPSVTPIWKILGQGSSLPPLRSTFDT